MKATVQILANGKPKKSKEGKVFLHECQCVVMGEEVQVGVLKIGDKAAQSVLKEAELNGVKEMVVPPGAYELEYGLGIGWDDKELKGVLKSITPIGRGNSALAALGQVPAQVSKPA